MFESSLTYISSGQEEHRQYSKTSLCEMERQKKESIPYTLMYAIQVFGILRRVKACSSLKEDVLQEGNSKFCCESTGTTQGGGENQQGVPNGDRVITERIREFLPENMVPYSWTCLLYISQATSLRILADPKGKVEKTKPTFTEVLNKPKHFFFINLLVWLSFVSRRYIQQLSGLP